MHCAAAATPVNKQGEQQRQQQGRQRHQQRKKEKKKDPSASFISAGDK
jgi:ribosomal protein S8E